MISPRPGDFVFVDYDPVRGNEQGRRRPALVVASDSYMKGIPNLTIVVPITSTRRGFPHHVEILEDDVRVSTGQRGVHGVVMTEQIRAIALERISTSLGTASPRLQHEVARWIRFWTRQ